MLKHALIFNITEQSNFKSKYLSHTRLISCASDSIFKTLLNVLFWNEYLKSNLIEFIILNYREALLRVIWNCPAVLLIISFNHIRFPELAPRAFMQGKARGFRMQRAFKWRFAGIPKRVLYYNFLIRLYCKYVFHFTSRYRVCQEHNLKVGHLLWVIFIKFINFNNSINFNKIFINFNKL